MYLGTGVRGQHRSTEPLAPVAVLPYVSRTVTIHCSPRRLVGAVAKRFHLSNGLGLLNDSPRKTFAENELLAFAKAVVEYSFGS